MNGCTHNDYFGITTTFLLASTFMLCVSVLLHLSYHCIKRCALKERSDWFCVCCSSSMYMASKKATSGSKLISRSSLMAVLFFTISISFQVLTSINNLKCNANIMFYHICYIFSFFIAHLISLLQFIARIDYTFRGSFIGFSKSFINGIYAIYFYLILHLLIIMTYISLNTYLSPNTSVMKILTNVSYISISFIIIITWFIQIFVFNIILLVLFVKKLYQLINMTAPKKSRHRYSKTPYNLNIDKCNASNVELYTTNKDDYIKSIGVVNHNNNDNNNNNHFHQTHLSVSAVIHEYDGESKESEEPIPNDIHLNIDNNNSNNNLTFLSPPPSPMNSVTSTPRNTKQIRHDFPDTQQINVHHDDNIDNDEDDDDDDCVAKFQMTNSNNSYNNSDKNIECDNNDNDDDDDEVPPKSYYRAKSSSASYGMF